MSTGVKVAVSARVRALILLVLVVPAGFAFKLYDGAGQWWINNWAASVAYEIFFILLVFIIIPRRSVVTRIAVAVCVITFALEFLQLWNPPWLEAIRSTFVGRSILGNAFSWKDFPAYPLGSFLGWVLLRRVVTSKGVVS